MPSYERSSPIQFRVSVNEIRRSPRDVEIGQGRFLTTVRFAIQPASENALTIYVLRDLFEEELNRAEMLRERGPVVIGVTNHWFDSNSVDWERELIAMALGRCT